MKKFLALTLTILIAGCATTDMTGYVDPKYRDHKISKVVVRAKGATLEEMLATEQKLSEKFSTKNVYAIKFSDLAPPTRKFTSAQEFKLMKKAGADSVLTVNIAGKDTVETYVPVTYHPGVTTSTVNMIGSTAYVNSYTTPGYTTGGYSVSSPTMATFSTLVDLRSGNRIWQGEGYTTGDGSYLALLINAGESAISDLEKNGLLPPIEKKK